MAHNKTLAKVCSGLNKPNNQVLFFSRSIVELLFPARLMTPSAIISIEICRTHARPSSALAPSSILCVICHLKRSATLVVSSAPKSRPSLIFRQRAICGNGQYLLLLVLFIVYDVGKGLVAGTQSRLFRTCQQRRVTSAILTFNFQEV